MLNKYYTTIQKALKVTVVVSFMLITLYGTKFNLPIWSIIFISIIFPNELAITLYSIISVLVCLYLLMATLFNFKTDKWLTLASNGILLVSSYYFVFNINYQSNLLDTTVITWNIFLTLSTALILITVHKKS